MPEPAEQNSATTLPILSAPASSPSIEEVPARPAAGPPRGPGDSASQTRRPPKPAPSVWPDEGTMVVSRLARLGVEPGTGWLVLTFPDEPSREPLRPRRVLPCRLLERMQAEAAAGKRPLPHLRRDDRLPVQGLHPAHPGLRGGANGRCERRVRAVCSRASCNSTCQWSRRADPEPRAGPFPVARPAAPAADDDARRAG